MRTLVWFRKDLRINDNPALAKAAEMGEIVPIFIWSPGEEGDWPPGSNSRNWLFHSLFSLDASFLKRKGKLFFFKGSSKENILKIVKKAQCDQVFWNRCYEPAIYKRDLDICDALEVARIPYKTFNSSLLIEPWEVQTKQNNPYQVFTPFWKAAQKSFSYKLKETPPLKFHSLKNTLSLKDLKLPDKEMKYWEPGEKGARKRLNQFIRKSLDSYEQKRDRSDLDGVSRLSPHLHFGEISPRLVYSKVCKNDAFTRQLFWREFAYHLLFHFPKTPLEPLKEEFKNFPWNHDEALFEKWKEGKTGIPIIDAGMRQLKEMGWMHNRVRLLVASFLVKDLLIPWQKGARWFWENLFDADLANNTLGWQWSAGCGADAAPYFRVFNPTMQAKKFDPRGDYIRLFIPELKEVPDEVIHTEYSSKKYPDPIIDHDWARKRALKAFRHIKRRKK